MRGLLLVLLFSVSISHAYARDTVMNIPLADVLAMPEAHEKLDGSVSFYLSGQKTPKVTEKMSSDVSNRKTNAVGKSDEESCRWVALSALLAFQESAKRNGANAVIDLVSYYKKNEVKSADSIECHAGGLMSGVALKGTYAKIAR